MTDLEILEGLGEIIEEIAGVPAEEVTPSKSFADDLDIDSLSMVEIAVAAQDKFGVDFEGHPGFELNNFTIYPFLFPFKVPPLLLPALVAFNKTIEKVPFFRWQCSSVVIVVDYTKQGR